ncbi:AP3-complex subunit beta-A [Hordeum vulgare]|nr:AP3-complex subunit beta-A [Hordeum vulgare]
MAALPVMKLGTLSKPIANRLKNQAAVYPKFGDFIINITQVQFSSLSRISFLGQGSRRTKLFLEGGMFGMRASGAAASWVVGRMGTDVHLYDDPKDAAILAVLDSRFDAHLIVTITASILDRNSLQFHISYAPQRQI